eukprot:CAMPEP_0202901038 /NCGR_PEP_ID=MMETSP1392-20130828/12878_1 /ASSEMBLY_ACC=CAM_ASM_000868 /TAXON_ID=225041 /ORGANISM="Chlamydomonas chlamydogama, Strain SAG 11-48b" /LENGTH=93 /DNA_ID=CAMNT_0049587523 /DNA_START=75 /DNA_END=356 /DNA_ORIENTATION=+
MTSADVLQLEAYLRALAADLRNISTEYALTLSSPTMCYQEKHAQLKYWVERRKQVEAEIAATEGRLISAYLRATGPPGPVLPSEKPAGAPLVP